jgi:hypothetical protein
MNVASRPVPTGKTRTCPHCKAVILESLSICPGCLHHLRFDQEAAKRQVAANSALKVEAVIRHPPLEEAWEYFVVIAVRNDKGEEVTRQVVNVGSLQPAEKRTFSLSVEVLPPQAPLESKPVQSQQPAAKPNGPPPLQAPPYKLTPPGMNLGTTGSHPKPPMPGAAPPQPPAKPAPNPANPASVTPAQAAGLKPPSPGEGPPKKK